MGHPRKSDAVAQYLVGAKLQLRFPKADIPNQSYSTADEQLGRAGDFEIGDTVFHVTISPTSGHYEKCVRNTERGLCPYLLVPGALLEGAKQNADYSAPGRITVVSIESFIAQNVDELGQFTIASTREHLRGLLIAYNARVEAVDTDRSLLVEVPLNLLD